MVCRRLPDRWTYPAFYSFVGTGFELPTFGGESADVIMLFMNEQSAGWLQKGAFKLEGDKRAVAGAVGELSSQQRDELGKANLIIYAVRGGKIVGRDFHSNSFNGFGIGHDNKLNKAIYGIKSSETLLGKQPGAKPLPEGIAAFQSTLVRQFPPNPAGSAHL
ncbi:MAG: YSC84-related protein [Pyrinomonadaceae bacterium]